MMLTCPIRAKAFSIPLKERLGALQPATVKSTFRYELIQTQETLPLYNLARSNERLRNALDKHNEKAWIDLLYKSFQWFSSATFI